MSAPRRSRTGWLPLVAIVATVTPLAASPSPGERAPADVGPIVPVPAKADASDVTFERSTVTRVREGRLRTSRATAGTLRGKTVYLSAGHGWYYGNGAWSTQRGNTHDLVEDFITNETVSQYLIPYLHAMGAYVVPIRESDLNPNLVIVDDKDAVIEGTIAELADQAGWGKLPATFTGTENPFALGRARKMMSSTSETGRAVYPAAVPVSGYYNVYVAYVQGTDRASDARVIVRHAGGESRLLVDQRRHGGTWVLLGRWYFEAGAPADRSSIVVTNESAEAGKVISFDAVRLGGGMAPHVRGGKTTGRPAYESSARYATQLLGAPSSVWGSLGDERDDDVISRPRFAAWEHEAGEDAVYLAVHTNAPSPRRGTMTLVFGPQYPCCGPRSEFSGTPGSLALLDAVHDEVVADLRAAWDPAWNDEGKLTAAIGELRPTHNNEMPSILVEIAYHDTDLDAEALREPRFRRLAARAIAQGVARYFATKDTRTLVLPPEPPRALRVENVGGHALRVSWRAPASEPGAGLPPTGYRVHVSTNGYGFDDGVEVTGESHVLSNLPPGGLVFVRVTSTNAGGDSLASEVVAARVAEGARADVLLVGGVDRLDKSQMVRDAAPMLGTVDRMWLERMNNGTYAVPHAVALASAGYAFDGASDDAVEEADLDLAAYRAIDWFVGEDSAEQDPLTTSSREALARFFAAGGGLLVSGSELVWSMQSFGKPDDTQFATSVLHATLAADDAGTYDVRPVNDLFAGLAPFSFANDTPLGYDVEHPDVLVAAGGATPVLEYATGGVAAIAWKDAGGKGVVVGFPLEAIVDDATRTELIRRALASFGVDPEEPPIDDCGCGASGSGSLPGLVVIGLFFARRRRR